MWGGCKLSGHMHHFTTHFVHSCTYIRDSVTQLNYNLSYEYACMLSVWHVFNMSDDKLENHVKKMLQILRSCISFYNTFCPSMCIFLWLCTKKVYFEIYNVLNMLDSGFTMCDNIFTMFSIFLLYMFDCGFHDICYELPLVSTSRNNRNDMTKMCNKFRSVFINQHVVFVVVIL